MRPLRSISLTQELLVELLADGEHPHVKISHGFPAGSRLAGASVDRRGCLVVTLEHESFEQVPEGREPALWSIRVESIPCLKIEEDDK